MTLAHLFRWTRMGRRPYLRVHLEFMRIWARQVHPNPEIFYPSPRFRSDTEMRVDGQWAARDFRRIRETLGMRTAA